MAAEETHDVADVICVLNRQNVAFTILKHRLLARAKDVIEFFVEAGDGFILWVDREKAVLIHTFHTNG